MSSEGVNISFCTFKKTSFCLFWAAVGSFIQLVRRLLTSSPHHAPPPSPLFLTVRLPVSHQCSPFFLAAVTESPALFPVLSARCLVTAEGAFAGGREVHFLSLTVPKLARGLSTTRSNGSPRHTAFYYLSAAGHGCEGSTCPRSFP